MLIGTAAQLQSIGIEGTLRDQEITLEDALERAKVAVAQAEAGVLAEDADAAEADIDSVEE